MTDDCLFCRIVKGEIPAEIVHDGSETLAFRDINPKAPTHVLVIPKKHIASLGELKREDAGLMGEIIWTASEIAREEKLDQEGFRLAINSGPAAGQTVFHIHAHVMGGRDFAWPPG